MQYGSIFMRAEQWIDDRDKQHAALLGVFLIPPSIAIFFVQHSIGLIYVINDD